MIGAAATIMPNVDLSQHRRANTMMGNYGDSKTPGGTGFSSPFRK
jgi:hypothetical protein